MGWWLGLDSEDSRRLSVAKPSAGQRVGPGVYVDAVRAARQSLYVTGPVGLHAARDAVRPGGSTIGSTAVCRLGKFSQVRRQGLEPRTRGLSPHVPLQGVLPE